MYNKDVGPCWLSAENCTLLRVHLPTNEKALKIFDSKHVCEDYGVKRKNKTIIYRVVV